jgi:hypothetical protein
VPARPVTASDLSDEPLVEHHRFRGHDYTFRELTITEYDKVVTKATDKDGNVDQQAFTRELVRSSGGLSPDEYAGLGTRLARQMGLIATQLHWAEEPDELKEDKDEDQGNAGSPPAK